ncbi:MAG: hypothetical protein H6Q25_261 [Bacteroidetes bacterium]|nr:hypothetical protein [Bacteroidota bacterium]
MKKILIVFVATCMFVVVNAQTDAGGKFIGGTIKIGTASFFNPDSVGYFKGNNFDFQIAPEFGYFVADNFAIGASLFFGTSTEKMFDEFLNLEKTQKISELSFGGGIFGHYFIELNKNLYLSFKGTLGYYNTKGETSITTPPHSGLPLTTIVGVSTTSNAITFNILPSIEYFVNDNLSLSLSFGNLYVSQIWTKNLLLTTPSSYTTTDFGLDLDLSSVKFGIKFFME